MDYKIADIAKLAKVSTATVSRVINEPERVSPKTRDKVRKVIEQTNYRISPIGRNLRLKKSNLIGLLVAQIYPNPFVTRLALEVGKEANKYSFDISILDSFGDPQRELENLRTILSYLPVGIIIIGYVSRDNLKLAIQQKVPVIALERQNPLKNGITIRVDQRYGAFLATDYLIKQGNNEIGFIGVKGKDLVEKQRFGGYLKALNKAGIKIREDLIQFGQYTKESGFALTKELISKKIVPKAIFVASDIMAAGVLQCLYQQNIKVPDRVSLAGMDNTLAPYLSPPIPSVDLMYPEIARKAIEVLIAKSYSLTDIKPVLVYHNK